MKFSKYYVVGIAAVVLIAAVVVRLTTTSKSQPRAQVYATSQNAQVDASTGVDHGVFIQLHDNSTKANPNGWTMWLYKYDGAEYLFVFNNGQIQFTKHK